MRHTDLRFRDRPKQRRDHSFIVEVFHLIHTCPANPEPHPVDTRRRIVHVTPSRPCLNAVTVRSVRRGDRTLLDLLAGALAEGLDVGEELSHVGYVPAWGGVNPGR